MDKLYCVTYTVDYHHRVMVGIKSSSQDKALAQAKQAFNEATIWDDTDEMPLLYDDYDEFSKDTLLFEAQEVSEFPQPDISVTHNRQKEAAFNACRFLLAGESDKAKACAFKAVSDTEPSEDRGTKPINQVERGIQAYCERLTTSDMLALAREHILEVSLTLDGGLRSTHFISGDSNGMVWDEGCDGERLKITEEEFLRSYPDKLGTIWRVDQMIPH